MTITRNRPLLYMGLIVASLLLGLALDQFGYLTPVRDLVQMALTPLQNTLTSTSQDISRRFEIPADIQALQARNAELEALANSLMVENVRLADIERENKILRQLLNYTRNNPQLAYETTTIIGRSIGFDPSNLLYFVYVDVGTRNGVARNMPVVTDRGLVGRVVAASPNMAQVLLLIDPASSVNAIIQNSRVTGVVRGSIDGTISLERIPPNEEVNPGDIVLTSGLGGNFPDKLVIGQVTEVIRRDQDMFQVARIRPTVDFGKLETMLIITSFEPIDFEAEILKAQEQDN
jgi:rod shape-determining protein MreC